MSRCMVYATVQAVIVIVTVWAGIITYNDSKERQREVEADKVNVREMLSQKIVFPCIFYQINSIMCWAFYKQEKGLFICSFVQPKQFSLLWQTGSWAALMKSVFFPFHYSVVTDACCWATSKLWCNHRDLVVLKLLYSADPRSTSARAIFK